MKQKITRKEIKERNQKMYEMYMNNKNLGNKDIAIIFGISLQSVDIILGRMKKENKVTRSIKPRDNKMGITEEEIINAFKQFKTLNKTCEKLNISAGYIAKVLRKNNLGDLIFKIRDRISTSKVKERNQKMWQYFIDNSPQNYHIIAEEFDLSWQQIKKIMVNLKKENDYPLGTISTKPKRIKKGKEGKPQSIRFQNNYEKVAYEKGIDYRNLFAY